MTVSDWADMMPSTVTIEPFVSRDTYNAPTFGTAVTYSARVVYKQKWLRKPDGSDVVAQGSVWLQSAARITPEDRLTLPDGTTHPILLVETPSDEAELHHTKIMFG